MQSRKKLPKFNLLLLLLLRTLFPFMMIFRQFGLIFLSLLRVLQIILSSTLQSVNISCINKQGLARPIFTGFMKQLNLKKMFPYLSYLKIITFEDYGCERWCVYFS